MDISEQGFKLNRKDEEIETTYHQYGIDGIGYVKILDKLSYGIIVVLSFPYT